MFSGAAFACSPVAGAVDDTSERIGVASVIFVLGILAFSIHSVIFGHRSAIKLRKSRLVYWVTFGLSIFIIPIVFLLIGLSAGMSCGFGAIEEASFLFVFEVIALIAQVVSWRISSQPVVLEIPRL